MKRTYIGCIAALVGVCLCAPALAANAGDVIITEMMINTANSETAPYPSLGEWIEIYNTTANPIDLTGWYFADEDGRSGAFESYTLPPHGIAVLISVGNGTNTLSKAQFQAVWPAVRLDQLVQPTATGDQSGPRPTNVVQGGIAGSGLSNSMVTDNNPANDLLNFPTYIHDAAGNYGACNYGQDYCTKVGTPAAPPDSEVEALVDNTGLIINMVHYTSAGSNGRSMALKENLLNGTDNQDWANWYNVTAGTKWAYNSTSSAPLTVVDTGSPGQIDTVTVGNQAPSASSFTKALLKAGSVDMYLAATDDGLPDPPKQINFVVDTLPTGGTLLDADNAHTIVAGDLPYTIPSQKLKLTYTNDGTSGNTSFTYHASDTSLNSGPATVSLVVEEGQVIITEIMYNPASDEANPAITEYLEIYNTTTSPIDLTNWYVKLGTNRSGDWPAGTVIPAGGVAVVIPVGNGSTRIMSPTIFQSAWGTMPQIIQATINNQAPPATDATAGGVVGGNLVNSPAAGGTQLQLIDGTGKTQDMASYTGSSPWPSVATSDGTSIYLKPGYYSAGDNNDGANWWKAYACSDGAMISLPTATNPPYDLRDSGSPGYIVGVSTGNRPPAPKNMYVTMLKDSGSKTFSLDVCDDGVGTPTFVFTILSLPVNGALKDPSAGNLDITTVPYILAGSSVTYTPNAGFNSTITPGAGTANGSENNDTFTYTVDEVAGLPSNTTATVNMIVQLGGVVITEIMYDPSHGIADNDWEFVEIKNTTGSDIPLAGLLNANLKNVDSGNLSYTAGIPAGATRVIVAPDTPNRTVDEFVAEWACRGLTLDNLLVIVGTKPALSNGGDTLFITDGGNNVIDRVHYSNGSSGWPASTNSASVYLSPSKVNVVDNDDPANWQLSVDGVASACATPETAGDTTTDSDVGSPGIIPAACTAPSITGQPTNQSVTSGATVNFTVTATGPTLNYQWYKGVTPLTNGGKISGATTATLTLTGVDATDAGSYKVVVSNGCAPDATSNVVSLSVCTPPIIITQPTGATVTAPAQFCITVSANGSGTLTYQWRKGGVNLADGGSISGATTATLCINPSSPSDSGSYDCVIGNGCGTPVTSNAVTVTVNNPTVTLSNWRSLKTHSGYGEIAITLNAAAVATGQTAGGIKVESRFAAAQNGLTKVQIDVSAPVTVVNPSLVTITGLATSGCDTAGNGCTSSAKAVTPTITMAAPQTLQLAFANNSAASESCYIIAIQDGALSAAISGDRDCKVRVLYGDASGDGLVNIGDLSYIKFRLSQPITSANASCDVNLAAGINLGDLSSSKFRLGRRAICP